MNINVYIAWLLMSNPSKNPKSAVGSKDVVDKDVLSTTYEVIIFTSYKEQK